MRKALELQVSVKPASPQPDQEDPQEGGPEQGPGGWILKCHKTTVTGICLGTGGLLLICRPANQDIRVHIPTATSQLYEPE